MKGVKHYKKDGTVFKGKSLRCQMVNYILVLVTVVLVSDYSILVN